MANLLKFDHSLLDPKQQTSDPRFIQMTDKSKECWTAYNEHHRCAIQKGVESDECRPLYDFRFTKCTNEMRQQFEEQIEANVWTGWKPKSQKKDNHHH